MTLKEALTGEDGELELEDAPENLPTAQRQFYGGAGASRGSSRDGKEKKKRSGKRPNTAGRRRKEKERERER